MKTLPEILRDVILLLDDGHESVVIVRGDNAPLDGYSSAFQLKLHHEVDLSAYRCEARSWLGEQWSIWKEWRGWLGGASFDIDDVLATDWRIVA